MIKVDVRCRVGGFALDARFASEAGVTAFFGRSGSGKTTLVNCVAGLVRPDSGSIEIDGECVFDSARGIDIPIERRRVGYVFQEGRLFPHLTVRGNLAFGPTRNRAAKPYVRFEQVVELLGLESLLERRPGRLSGGEKQRVAIGRALLASPRVLLLDEPLAALDALRKSEVLRYIERLHDEIRVPIVYVSHAVEEIVRLADYVVLLAGGKSVACGNTADIMGRAELRAANGIFEGGTVVDARVLAHDLDYDLSTLEFAGGSLVVNGVDALVGERLRLRIRARDVSLALQAPRETSISNVMAGTVAGIAMGEGPHAHVTVNVGAATLAARITRKSVARLGLHDGCAVYALIKAVSLDRESAGHA